MKPRRRLTGDSRRARQRRSILADRHRQSQDEQHRNDGHQEICLKPRDPDHGTLLHKAKRPGSGNPAIGRGNSAHQSNHVKIVPWKHRSRRRNLAMLEGVVVTKLGPHAVGGNFRREQLTSVTSEEWTVTRFRGNDRN